MLTTPVDEALRAAEHFFGVRSRGYTVFCRSDVDSDLAAACRRPRPS